MTKHQNQYTMNTNVRKGDREVRHLWFQTEWHTKEPISSTFSATDFSLGTSSILANWE